MSDQAGKSEAWVLSREEVRRCDRVALERYGLCGLVLMENAGGAAARWLLGRLGTARGARVCVLAGPGNNGGDGFVVARHLHNAAVTVEVVICSGRDKYRGDAASNLSVIERMGLSLHYVNELTGAALGQAIREYAAPAEWVVDALLGTGTSGPPREPIRTVIENLNDLGKQVLALDIPSGLDCDTGAPLELAVRAGHTVTFAALKKGFLAAGAETYTGGVTVASIGIDTGLLVG